MDQNTAEFYFNFYDNHFLLIMTYLRGGGGQCLKKTFRFPLDVIQNSVVSTKILAKIYRVRLKECAYKKISSILTKTSENCIYIVNLYFWCNFSMPLD